MRTGVLSNVILGQHMPMNAPSSQPLLRQYIRFAATGTINTAIDFSILNLLLALFRPDPSSIGYAVFKSISFMAALVNSYFMNKRWVFKKEDIEGQRSQTESSIRTGQKVLFVFVSIVSFAANVGVSSVLFFVLAQSGGMSIRLAANIGAIAGVAVSQVTNFLGYKFLVFTPRHA